MERTSSREYPRYPIVGVGAVVLKDGQILLIKRLHEPGAGQWTFPGGAVELGEGLEEATLREVWEECGIRIAIRKLAGVVNRVIPDEEGRIQYHYVIVDYLAQPLSDQLKAGSDVAEAAWVPLNELDRYALASGMKEFLHDCVELEIEN
ncbi:MAG: NUDIX hydrolase [Nitrospinae bacterium]|nr:NUDIX hydrolase [Nitrospinota bacterium]